MRKTLHNPRSLPFASLLLACLAASAGWAVGTGPVPQAESFESYAVGSAIDQAPGWTISAGTAPDAATGRVTTNAFALAALASYTGTLPLDTTHAKVLELGRPMVDQQVAAPAGRLVRTDFLVLPWPRQALPEADPAMRLGLCFDANGQAAIFHRNANTGSNEWRTLGAATPVGSQSWVRVTFLQDDANHLFQLRINDGAPLEDAAGWSGPPPGATPGGAWFAMPATNGAMSRISFEGGGQAFLDDLEIVSELPEALTLPASNVTATAADLVGYLSFTGLAQTAAGVYWGTTDGGTNAAAWASTNVWAAPQVQGRLAHTAAVLTNTVVYYRYAASNAFGHTWSDHTEAVVVGAVRLNTGADNSAAERPVDTARFRIVRPTWATNVALTVNYALGGTAENGVDYTTLPGSVVLPVGALSVDVVLTPITDGAAEGDEEAELTLLPGAYLIGSPDTTLVTIIDAAPLALTWVNTSGDRKWNSTSTNWLGNDVRFFPNDPVTFMDLPTATGRVYVVSAPGAPADVRPGAMTVSGGLYDFEGGAMLGGPVAIQGGRVIDRNLTRTRFGDGTITLSGGGEFWRQIPPDGVARIQVLSNALAVAGTGGAVQGGRGTNEWRGAVDLKTRFSIGSTNAVVGHINRFTGTLTVDQDTNNAAARVVALRAGGGAAFLDGAIMDSTNHTGSFPLVLETAAGSGFLTLRGSNTYAHGTVVTNAGGANGVVVAAGSSLGSGPVTVRGDGAKLLVQGAGAIAATLAVASNATVTLAADEAVAGGVGSRVTVADGGLLVLQSGNCLPDEGTLDLSAAGRVLTTNRVEAVGDLVIGGVHQQGGTYTRDNRPEHILGEGALRVKGAVPTGLLLLVR